MPLSGQTPYLCQAQGVVDDQLGVAVVPTYEAKHYGCWLISSSPFKVPSQLFHETPHRISWLDRPFLTWDHGHEGFGIKGQSLCPVQNRKPTHIRVVIDKHLTHPTRNGVLSRACPELVLSEVEGQIEGVSTRKRTACRERSGGHWKAEPETAAPAYLTLDPHLTTVSLDQVTGDGQPQAGTAS